MAHEGVSRSVGGSREVRIRGDGNGDRVCRARRVMFGRLYRLWPAAWLAVESGGGGASGGLWTRAERGSEAVRSNSAVSRAAAIRTVGPRCRPDDAIDNCKNI